MFKSQFIKRIPKLLQGNVGQVLSQRDMRDMKQEIAAELDLVQIMDRNLEDLYVGELQRFAIASYAVRKGDIYFFDEPSSYLDVKQRLKAAQVFRSLVRPDKLVMFIFSVSYQNFTWL